MPDELDTLLRQLKELKELRDSGALAEGAYEEQVADLLAGRGREVRVAAATLRAVPSAAAGPAPRPSRSRGRHPSGGSALIATPLGTSSNSSVASGAVPPPSPLALALETAKKTTAPPDPPVKRQSSYWSRAREGRSA
jgi:hypothetical protein